MNLKNKITQEIKEAMKAKNSNRLEVLRFLFSQIKNKEISLRPTPITDKDIISVIQKQAKQRQEGIKQFQSGGRSDLAEKEQRELAILKEFLPQPLTENELKKVIDSVIASLSCENGSKDKRLMGQVIKGVIAQVQGRADSKTISQLVSLKLNQVSLQKQ